MTTAPAKFTSRQPASHAEMITLAMVEDLNRGLSQRGVAAEDVISVLFTDRTLGDHRVDFLNVENLMHAAADLLICLNGGPSVG